MFNKKIKITLTLGIIFLLSMISVAQAAPPLQGRSGTSQGHNLDLDAEGNNLGAVVSGNKDEAKAAADTGDSDKQNHVAAALAAYFDEMSYEEIMALHESGVGFGNIAKALYFTAKFDLGIGAADLVAEAGQSGWGKTLRDNGIHPGSLGKGKGHQPEQAGAKANNGQGNSDGNHGQGNGNNNQGQGNGSHGQGHGKGKNKGGSGDDQDDVDSDDDDDATSDVDEADSDDDDDDNGNANSQQGNGKSKGNNGQGKGKGNGNGNSHGKGNNGQGNGNNGNGNQDDDD